jgi:L-threonylcarbamoyladenylate synthase
METAIFPNDGATASYLATLLSEGQIVALPTETVYGLAANALDPAAVRKIYAAKGRPSDNPLIVHVTGREQATQLGRDIPGNAFKLMDEFWPGPLTIVLPKNLAIPDGTTGGRPDVGLRAPAHPAFQAVLHASGLALAAPSANRAGRPSPTTAAHVYQDMAGRIPAILDGGPCAVGLESTVISLVGAEPVLLRPGGISLEQLRMVVGKVAVDPAVTTQIEAGRSPGAPGMKYAHYAPRTPITLVRGSAESFARFVASQALLGSVGVLCFDDAVALFPTTPAVTFGPRHDAVAQARQLFAALHQVDGLGVGHVFAQVSPETTGVFLAVRNRLLKAAAHRVVNI